MLRETWNAPAFNWGYHVMIGVIGASFTVEYAAKGLYETTIGRFTARLADGAGPTAEDRFLRQTAQDYAAFIHTTPWYAFPFWDRLRGLWDLPEPAMGHPLRCWERRFEGTVELLFKTAWGWIIQQGTAAGYDPEADTIQVWARSSRPEAELPTIDARIKVLTPLGGPHVLLSLPRYEPFRAAVEALIRQDVQLLEVAGNEGMLLTLLAPQDWQPPSLHGTVICEWTLLTDPRRKRVALFVPVQQLDTLLPAYDHAGLVLDHLFDF